MDIRRKQRAVVDALEDVKGRDILVFNVAQLSPFFERVVIASGDSSRQLKALADSVRRKLAALGEHASQLQDDGIRFFEEWLPAAAVQEGERIGVEHGESFRVLNLKD